MSASAGKVLLMPKGDYNSGTTYEVLDWVRYDSKAYVCKQTSTGNLPTNTTYWQLLVQDGASPATKMSYYDNGILGAKNLFEITAETQTTEGVTFTVGSDGKVTVTGTASANGAYLTLGTLTLEPGTYRKTGCPGTGTSSTYYLGGSNTGTDYGSGDTVTIASSVSASIVIAIEPNYAITESLVFEPMLVLDSDQDTTFRKFAMTNKQLTDRVMVLTSTAASLASDISDIQGDIDDIEGDIDDIQGDITDLQGDLDEYVGPSYANSAYKVVFDNLDNTYGYMICMDDKVGTYEPPLKGTGTSSGMKLTYTVGDKYTDITDGSTGNVATGSNGTPFYLRVMK